MAWRLKKLVADRAITAIQTQYGAVSADPQETSKKRKPEEKKAQKIELGRDLEGFKTDAELATFLLDRELPLLDLHNV